MNNDQSDCPKCYRKFHNKSSLAHHLETCNEGGQKTPLEQDECRDPLALDETIVPGEDNMETEIESDLVAEADEDNESNMKMERKYEMEYFAEKIRNETSEETEAVAVDDETFTRLEGEIKTERSEKKDESIIEILDTEEKPQMVHVGPSPPLPPVRKVFPAPRFSRGKGKLGRLDCYYCGSRTSSRISLTKHLVGQHWDQVRERQGGGRRDNRQSYRNIQDDRVIKPGLNKTARTTAYFANLPPPNRKILPRPAAPVFNWAAQIKAQDFDRYHRGTILPSVPRNSKSLLGNTQNRKIAPRPSNTSGTISPSVTRRSFFGKTPNRKIAPNLSYNGTPPSVPRNSNRKIAPTPSYSGTGSPLVTKSVPFSGKTPNRNTVLRPSNSVITSGGQIQAKGSIPTYDLTRPSLEARRREPTVSSRSNPAPAPARSSIPNTNHRSLNKVGPNSELHKLVKKFANSNSSLQITKVSK